MVWPSDHDFFLNWYMYLSLFIPVALNTSIKFPFSLFTCKFSFWCELMCEYMFMYVHMRLHVHLSVCTCVLARGHIQVCFLGAIHLGWWDSPLTGLEIASSLSWLARELHGSICVFFPALGLQIHAEARGYHGSLSRSILFLRQKHHFVDAGRPASSRDMSVCLPRLSV